MTLSRKPLQPPTLIRPKTVSGTSAATTNDTHFVQPSSASMTVASRNG
jgi:hypothetical protein